MNARVFLFLLAATGTTTLHADNWPQWRGPTQNNLAAPGEYPTSWSETKNIVWKVAVPGWGTSTPAIWDDSIVVTGTEDEQNVVVCLGRNGQTKWKTLLGTSAGNRNRKASGANPSPVTDGHHVYVYFRSGDLGCLDFDGQVIWQTNLQQRYGEDRLNWDLGTSPVLAGSRVIVAVMHQGPSYLAAFDKLTGEVDWKHDRNLDAPAEARDSYTTPLVTREGDDEVLIVLGADHVTAHDTRDGKERWRFGGLNPDQQRNFRQIASPVANSEVVIAPYARGETLTAIRRGGLGELTATHEIWKSYEASADVPCPVIVGDHVYVCNDRGDVSSLSLATGNVDWTENLPRNRYAYSSSPIVANGLLYNTREDGTTFVLRLGERPELVATNELRENTYATPAFVDGKIYLRTSDFLFCIGEVSADGR